MNQLISLPKVFAQVPSSSELLTAIFLKLKTMAIVLIKGRNVVVASFPPTQENCAALVQLNLSLPGS